MKDAEKDFRKFLKKKDLRCTRERFVILREVLTTREHFEADDIHLRLKEKKFAVSQASVYRTLPLLLEAGIVRKTPCDVMNARYEQVYGTAHHDHMVCLSCGKIIEFKSEKIEELQKTAARRHGFKMMGHRLVISGLCKDCR